MKIFKSVIVLCSILALFVVCCVSGADTAELLCLDEYGNEIDCVLPGETFYVSLDVDSVESYKGIRAYVASYMDNNLVDVETDLCDAIGDDGRCYAEFKSTDKQFDKIKVMMWDENLRPVAQNAELKPADVVCADMSNQVNGMIYLDKTTNDMNNISYKSLSDKDFISWRTGGKEEKTSRFGFKSSTLLDNIVIKDGVAYELPRRRVDNTQKEMLSVKPGCTEMVDVPDGCYNKIFYLAATYTDNNNLEVQVNYADGTKEIYENCSLLNGYQNANKDKANLAVSFDGYGVWNWAWSSMTPADNFKYNTFYYSVNVNSRKIVDSVSFKMSDSYSCYLLSVSGKIDIGATVKKTEELLDAELLTLIENEDAIYELLETVEKFGVKKSEISGVERLDTLKGSTFEQIDISSYANGLLYRDVDTNLAWDKGNGSIYGKKDFITYDESGSSRFALQKSSVNSYLKDGLLNGDNACFIVPEVGKKEALVIRKDNPEIIELDKRFNEVHFLIATVQNKDFNVTVSYADGTKNYNDNMQLYGGYGGANTDKDNFVCGPKSYSAWYNSDKFVSQSTFSLFEYSVVTDADKDIEKIEFDSDSSSYVVIAVTGENWGAKKAYDYVVDQMKNNDLLIYSENLLKRIQYLAETYGFTLDKDFDKKIAEKNIYVDMGAVQGGEGSIESPLDSIEDAQQLIRSLPRHERENMNVNIKGGEYKVSQTILFSEQDSGIDGKPIVYKSYDGDVVLSGMTEIDLTKAEIVCDEAVLSRLPVKAHGKVIQIDLAKQNLLGYGTVYEGYYGQKRTAATELVWNDIPLDRSRWPNNGEYAFVKEYLNGGTPHVNGLPAENDTGISFAVENTSENFAKWESSKNAILVGTWKNSYATDYLMMKGIDAENSVIYTKTSPSGVNLDFRRSFYIENLLEEIDTEGEWYIDPDSDILYLYPPSDYSDNSVIKLAVFDDDVIRFENAENIQIENIILDGGKSNAVRINNSRSCVIMGGEIRNFLGNGVNIYNSKECGVQSCDIKHISSYAVYTSNDGVCMQTLEKCNNFVRNCKISDVSRNKIGSYAIIIGAEVGDTIANNEIFDMKSQAILIMGNDNIVEYNDIHNVASALADAGVIYSGQRFTDQGNIYRYNYIHDIIQDSTKTQGTVVGIYMDDMDSGATIYGNIINNVPTGILVGGGKNVTVENNIIMNSPKSVNKHSADCSISVDARGLSWAAASVDSYAESAEWYWNKCEIWRERYPWMGENYFDSLKAYPTNDVIKNNVLYNHNDTSIEDAVKEYGEVKSNITYIPFIYGQLFVDETKGDLRINSNSLIFRFLKDFKAIPFENIGVYADDFRKIQ